MDKENDRSSGGAYKTDLSGADDQKKSSWAKILRWQLSEA